MFRVDCITGESPPIVTGFTKQSTFSIFDYCPIRWGLLVAALLVGCGPGGSFTPLYNQGGIQTNDMVSWNGDADEMVVWNDEDIYSLVEEVDMELEANEEDTDSKLSTYGFSSCDSK